MGKRKSIFLVNFHLFFSRWYSQSKESSPSIFHFFNNIKNYKGNFCNEAPYSIAHQWDMRIWNTEEKKEL